MRSQRGLVTLLMLIVPLSQVPLDIYTPAMPQMAIDLNASSVTMQNTVTAYMLGMSLAFIPIGVIADARGRKPVLLVCLGLLVVTSLACAAANGAPMLLAVRFIQGAAACAALVLTYAIAADSFRGSRLTSISGLLGAAWGLAPVLAPAVGGVVVQFVSWRWIFLLVAALAAAVGLLVFAALPETLAPASRSPVDLVATGRAAKSVLGSGVFVAFVVVFGVMASAQLAFGVAGPFLYQDRLGFSAALYGAVALGVGAANLAGELACGLLAPRMSARRLAFGALTVFAAGAVILVSSAWAIGANAWAISIGAALALAGCGVLCPQMYGLALGMFSRNLGLVGGIVSAGCYLIVSCVLAVVGVLPEHTQGPLGWLYAACGSIAFVVLWWATLSSAQDRAVTSTTVEPEIAS